MMIFFYGEDVFRSGQKIREIRNRFLEKDPAGSGLSVFDYAEKSSGTDPLGALTQGIEAAERGSIENLVGDIRNWSRLLDGSGAMEQTALERFLAIASELARADPQTARQRTVVASGAVDALRTTHGRASAQLAKSRESLRGGVEELLPLASEAERAQARDLLERPLPDRLVDAQETIAAIRQWMVSLRAREARIT